MTASNSGAMKRFTPSADVRGEMVPSADGEWVTVSEVVRLMTEDDYAHNRAMHALSSRHADLMTRPRPLPQDSMEKLEQVLAALQQVKAQVGVPAPLKDAMRLLREVMSAKHPTVEAPNA